MTPLSVADTSRMHMSLTDAQSDAHDRALVRHMLTLTPTERLRNVSAFWPVVRVGLERRRAVGAAPRP